MALVLFCASSVQGSDAGELVSSPAAPERGRFDMQLGYAYRQASTAFGDDGLPEPSEPAATWSAHEIRLEAHYGITTRAAFDLFVPVIYPKLENEARADPLTNARPTLGDSELRLHRQLAAGNRPFRELRLELRATAPTGMDSPGPVGSTLLTGTGIPRFGLGLVGRRQLGPSAAGVALLFSSPVSSVVSYAEAVYPDGSSGDARFRPGDRVDLTLELQAAVSSWLLLEGELHGALEGSYRVGTTTTWWLPLRDLEMIPNTRGVFADAGVKVYFLASSKLDFVLFSRYRFYGRTIPELAALGLEAFSPPPGLSGGVAVTAHL